MRNVEGSKRRAVRMRAIAAMQNPLPERQGGAMRFPQDGPDGKRILAQDRREKHIDREMMDSYNSYKIKGK